MIFPVDINILSEKNLDEYKNPDGQVIVRETFENYENRYSDILKDSDGNNVELVGMNMNQAEDYMTQSEFEKTYTKACNDYYRFLDDLKKKALSQELAGKVIWKLIQHVEDLQEKVKTYKIYKDLLEVLESFSQSSYKDLIFEYMVHYDPRLLVGYSHTTGKGLSMKFDTLKSMIQIIPPKVLEFYLMGTNSGYTGEQKQELRAMQNEFIGPLKPLLEQNIYSRFKALKEDPSLVFFQDVYRIGIDTQWFQDHGYYDEIKTDQGMIQFIVLIARNLYNQGISQADITQWKVQKEIEHIFEKRNQYANIEIFHNRDVLVWAGAEENTREEAPDSYDQDSYRFGKDAVVDAIENQGGDVERIRAEKDDFESAKEIKTKMLESLKNQSKPMTLIFDMHMGTKDIVLYEKADKLLEISVDELFDAYIERAQKYEFKDGEQDIFVIAGCNNHHFGIHEFAKKLAEYNKEQGTRIPIPIMITASEYGQYAKSTLNSLYGNPFFEKTLGLSILGRTTIRNVIEADQKQEGSNPSLYIFDENDNPIQLSQILENQERIQMTKKVL